MTLQRSERYFHSRAAFPSRPQLSLLSDNPYPGESFLDEYQQWMDNPVTLLLPSGIMRLNPDEKGMESRYNFLISTFEERRAGNGIKGAYSEIAAGVILRHMVEGATGGEYTVLPTPPQLDVCGQRRVVHVRKPGLSEPEKTADIMLGKVMEIDGEWAIKPLMLFDVKSCAREERTTSRIGIGVNMRLTPLPVGIFYLGGMNFLDAAGGNHTAADYIEEVVYPAILENALQWETVWPDGVSQNPRKQLFLEMCEEALDSCKFTKKIIEKDNWEKITRQQLIQNISDAEEVFRKLQAVYG